VRVLECRDKWGDEWADFLPDCIANELASHTVSRPASSVSAPYDSLFFWEGSEEPNPDQPDSDLIYGIVLSNASAVDAAWPHDAYGTDAPVEYQCDRNASAEEYAQARVRLCRDMCWDAEWKVDRAIAWYTGCWGSREMAERFQAAFIALLEQGALQGCYPGPLYNQLMVRWSLHMITGVFYSPSASREAFAIHAAITGFLDAFSIEQSVHMMELVEWPQHSGVNCYSGHGVLLLKATHITVDRCVSLCAETKNCTAVTVHSNVLAGDCWLLSDVRPEHCEQPGSGYDTYVMPNRAPSPPTAASEYVPPPTSPCPWPRPLCDWSAAGMAGTCATIALVALAGCVVVLSCWKRRQWHGLVHPPQSPGRHEASSLSLRSGSGMKVAIHTKRPNFLAEEV